MNTLGTILRLTSYGESHGDSVGAVLDGFPSNFKLDRDFIQLQLDRRKPGQSKLSSSRKEEDEVQINSGVFEGKSTGAPIHFWLKNKDSRPEDYAKLKDLYRPSHADYSYQAKYGIRDYRGGGRSSARVTAAWVAAGALAQQYLKEVHGMQITAWVHAIGKISCADIPSNLDFDKIEASLVRCPNAEVSEGMIKAIELAKEKKDSLGGVVRCSVSTVKAGLGEPVFGKLSAKLGHAMLSINAVKGFEVGGGFEMSKALGSEVNDQFVAEENTISTKTNFSGGIQGGISNGMDLDFAVAFKPTATIGVKQHTINTDSSEVELEAKGRHDPCVVPRAVPIVETLTALVLLDSILLARGLAH